MADGLTEAAKAEIAAAIAIVRADRFEQHARGVFAKFAPAKEEKPKDELIEDEPKEKETAPPPPPKEKEVAPKEEEPKRRSAYWGEILE